MPIQGWNKIRICGIFQDSHITDTLFTVLAKQLLMEYWKVLQTIGHKALLSVVVLKEEPLLGVWMNTQFTVTCRIHCLPIH